MVKTRYCSDLPQAITKAITDIRENDSYVITVEIHGPHSGFKIELQESTPLPPNHWKVTEIKK